MTAGSYLAAIWRSRYFWLNLVGADLRARWRRSTLGIFWTLLQPIGFALLLTFVLGVGAGVGSGDSLPFVLSGLLVWDLITASITGGAVGGAPRPYGLPGLWVGVLLPASPPGGPVAFLQADAYIRQHRQPLAIYTLRASLGPLAHMATASPVLLGAALLTLPQNFGWSWLALPLIFPLALLTVWPLATLVAFPTVRFRDIAHGLGLLLQAAWFLSPIYFLPDFFRQGGLDWLVDCNPLYHLLQIVRAPLLLGQWPTVTNLAVCGLTIVVLWALAALVVWRSEDRVIRYL